jgi:trigger factor
MQMDEELTDAGAPERKFAVTVRSEGQCKRILSIDIPEAEVERERERITAKLRRDLKVPGFRKGKIPLAYVKKNYAHAIQGDAVQNLLPGVYEDAVVSKGLHPLGEPHFDNLRAEPGSGIQADATIEVRPEVEIKGYRDVTVLVERREITDADVASTLNDLRERLASLETVDREARSSDYVTIDYAPYLESGAVDEKARQRNYPVELSSESLFEEFRVGLVGRKAGDETELTVKYPDDFTDREFAGRTRRFQVKVLDVKEKLLPEIDDAFAKRINDEVASLGELKSKIREDLVHEEKHRFEHEVEEKVIDQVIAHNPFEVPGVMVENYIASIVEEDRRRRPRERDEAKRTREIHDLFHDAAVRTIKKYFIMDAIRKQENIDAETSEVEAKIQSIADDAGKPFDEVKDYFAHPERNRRLKGDLIDAKVLALLRGGARIKDAA